MKKTAAVFIILLILTGTSYQPIVASPHGVLLKDYHSITLYTETSILANYQTLKEIILLPETNFNETIAAEMIQRINNIYSPILESLRNEGVQLKLFTGSLTDEPSVSYLKGKKPRGYSEDGPTWDSVPGIGGSQVVLAKIGHSEKGNGHGSLNLELHELAHSIDIFVLDSIRENSSFLETWKQEAKFVFPNRDYFLNYPEEYFAETFAMYFYSKETREQLKDLAPLTYDLFVNLETFNTPSKSTILDDF